MPLQCLPMGFWLSRWSNTWSLFVYRVVGDYFEGSELVRMMLDSIFAIPRAKARPYLLLWYRHRREHARLKQKRPVWLLPCQVWRAKPWIGCFCTIGKESIDVVVLGSAVSIGALMCREECNVLVFSNRNHYLWFTKHPDFVGFNPFAASLCLTSILIFVCTHKQQPFKPPIHLSDSDFVSITQNGQLCDYRGQVRPRYAFIWPPSFLFLWNHDRSSFMFKQLGPKEFEVVMRRQIRHVAQVRLHVSHKIWFDVQHYTYSITCTKDILRQYLSIRISSFSVFSWNPPNRFIIIYLLLPTCQFLKCVRARACVHGCLFCVHSLFHAAWLLLPQAKLSLITRDRSPEEADFMEVSVFVSIQFILGIDSKSSIITFKYANQPISWSSCHQYKSAKLICKRLQFGTLKMIFMEQTHTEQNLFKVIVKILLLAFQVLVDLRNC